MPGSSYEKRSPGDEVGGYPTRMPSGILTVKNPSWNRAKAPMWGTRYGIMHSLSAQLDNDQFYYSISLAECLAEWINYHFLCLWYDIRFT